MALKKRLPIFVHSMLPGQEKINMKYLKDQGLIFELEQDASFETQLLSILKNDNKMAQWEQSIDSYLKGIEINQPEQMVDVINGLLDQEASSVNPVLAKRSRFFRLAKVN
jgi:hypothetical protein